LSGILLRTKLLLPYFAGIRNTVTE
jgi:hypothetical protein